MKTCTINGIKISFVDRGQGATLLLVHGFPLDHSMWNGQIEALSARYRVIAPDLRGFGQSGVTEGTVTMAQQADDLAALLDFLSIREPVVYCGLSMGGYIALEFWRKYSKRLRALILCDTRSAADMPEAAANRLVIAEKVMPEGSQIVADVMMPKLFHPITLQKQPEVVEKLKQVMCATDPRGVAAARGMAQRADFTAELPRIACPTLIIVGKGDAISPAAEMQGISNAIPNAEFKIIPQAGHMAPLEQPADVNAAIELFLKRNGIG
jgi:pimeloyl-ACP methyl ester carboxylesterase